MGKLIRFDPNRRKSRRWTSASDYVRQRKRPPEPPKFGRGGKGNTWAQAFREVRPILLLIALVTLWVVFTDARRFGGPGFLQGDPDTVSAQFTRCGPGRGEHCVIDGDTFKIGERSIRVVGIDTAEVDARCPAEARQAERSTQALQDWLGRGPFTMTARLDEPTDRYGRDLRTVTRMGADGSEDRLADYMLREGGARAYWGFGRGGWC